MLTVANGMNLYVIISATIQSSTNVLVGHNYEAEAMENHFEAFFFFFASSLSTVEWLRLA